MNKIIFRSIPAGLLLSLAVAFPALAETITVSEARAHINPVKQRLEVLMTIHNAGSADRIYAVRSDVADAGQMSGGIDKREGKSHEDHVAATVIDIPADGSLKMTGKVSHIELAELTRKLNVGDTVDITLFFERAGRIKVSVPITPETEEGEGHKEEGEKH